MFAAFTVATLMRSQGGLLIFLTDRRAVTSLEYALLAAVIGLVLVEVLQVPFEAVTAAITAALGGSGGQSPGQ